MATRSAKIDQKADLIWAIADKLTGVYKPHEYGDVILPLTVLKRFDSVLSDTKSKVLEASKKFPETFAQRDFILKETGIKTNILRFPGGSNQAKGLKTSIIKEISNMGYGYVDWDLETGDGKKIAPTIKESIDNVLNKTNDRDIVVILMHDYSSITLSALPSIIEGLEKQNYIMLPLFYESVKVKKS